MDSDDNSDGGEMGRAVPPKRAKNRTSVNRTIGLVNFEESKKEIVRIVSQRCSKPLSKGSFRLFPTLPMTRLEKRTS